MIFVAQRRAVLVDQRSVRAAGAHPVHEFAKASPGLTGQRVTGMPQVANVVLSPARRIRGPVTSATARGPRPGTRWILTRPSWSRSVLGRRFGRSV